MKKALHLGLGLFVLLFFAVSGWASHGRRGKSSGNSATGLTHSHAVKSSARSNAGGKTRGTERAEQIQSKNTTADTNRGFTTAPGLDKAEKHSAEEKAEHAKGKASAKKSKGKKADTDDKDESHD